MLYTDGPGNSDVPCTKSENNTSDNKIKVGIYTTNLNRGALGMSLPHLQRILFWLISLQNKCVSSFAFANKAVEMLLPLLPPSAG